MNKFLITLATIAAVTFGGAASATHVSILIEGMPFVYGGASFCIDKESAVSIISDLEKNGMASSIKVYQDLVAEKKCVGDSSGGVFIPLSLVYEWKEAVVVEGTKGGTTIFFVSPNAEFIEAGEPV